VLGNNCPWLSQRKSSKREVFQAVENKKESVAEEKKKSEHEEDSERSSPIFQNGHKDVKNKRSQGVGGGASTILES